MAHAPPCSQHHRSCSQFDQPEGTVSLLPGGNFSSNPKVYSQIGSTIIGGGGGGVLCSLSPFLLLSLPPSLPTSHPPIPPPQLLCCDVGQQENENEGGVCFRIHTLRKNYIKTIRICCSIPLQIVHIVQMKWLLKTRMSTCMVYLLRYR